MVRFSHIEREQKGSHYLTIVSSCIRFRGALHRWLHLKPTPHVQGSSTTTTTVVLTSTPNLDPNTEPLSIFLTPQLNVILPAPKNQPQYHHAPNVSSTTHHRSPFNIAISSTAI